MSVGFLYFLTVISIGLSLGLWSMSERSFYNGLEARAKRPQGGATQMSVPYVYNEVLNVFATFFSQRWYRVDYFDPERGVIIGSNLYSKIDSTYFDVRLTADGPDHTVISVRVGTKFGLYRSEDRQRANKALLATLHAALFAVVSEIAPADVSLEGSSASD